MKRFLVGMMSFLLFAACNNPKPEEAAETAPATTETKPQPAEFADPKYSEIGKSGLASMSSGDIDGWSSNWADNTGKTEEQTISTRSILPIRYGYR